MPEMRRRMYIVHHVQIQLAAAYRRLSALLNSIRREMEKLEKKCQDRNQRRQDEKHEL